MHAYSRWHEGRRDLPGGQPAVLDLPVMVTRQVSFEVRATQIFLGLTQNGTPRGWRPVHSLLRGTLSTVKRSAE